MFQLRRLQSRGGVRDPFYSPERDLAYLGPNLVYLAMEYLSRLPDDDPWLTCLAQPVEESQLLPAVHGLGKAMCQVIQTGDLEQALESSGFAQADAAAKLLIYAAIGKVALAAVWSTVKDVHRPQDSPPLAFTQLFEETEKLCQQ